MASIPNKHLDSSKRPVDDAGLEMDDSRDSKRRKQAAEALTKPTGEDEESKSQLTEGASIVSYEWVGSGHYSPEAGRTYHDAIRLTTHGKTFIVGKGDTVLLWSETAASGEDWQAKWICVVDDIYWNPKIVGGEQNPVQFTARWFATAQDLSAQLSRWPEDSRRHLKSLLDGLGVNELVLTDAKQENDITSIQSLCDVHFIPPFEPLPAHLSGSNVYICRYHLSLDNSANPLILPKSTARQPPPGTGAARYSVASTDSFSSEDDEDDYDEESLNLEHQRDKVIQEGEGSTLRDDILVGTKHQAQVGPFVPGQVVTSRNPKLIWKPDAISNEKLEEFLKKLEPILTAYLNKHELSTTDEPYTPLPTARAEELMRSLPGAPLLTGSSLSSASMLSGSRSNNMRKECNAEAILALLSNHDFDTAAALEAAQGQLESLTTGWSPTEREIFDQAFRRHQGNLRMIAKVLAPTKTIKDVIDYHFRFKIPDQFRRYQDKKREQAVRMIECIETRRYQYQPQSLRTNGGNHHHEGKDRTLWSDTAVTEVTGAVADRQNSAKSLLDEVNCIMGKETLVKVAALVRQLHSSFDLEDKEMLLQIFKNHPDLQRRFLEFLPRSV